MTETDLALPGGRRLHVYDAGGREDRLAVFWSHGTPNVGAPPVPLFDAADRLGLRWISYDRPGYGGSTPRPVRDIASAAGDVERIADALGLARFAVVGHSGGGPHALACGALLSERVRAVVSMAGLAPFGAEGLDWFDGMTASGVASLRAAAAGRAAKERHETAPLGLARYVPTTSLAFRGTIRRVPRGSRELRARDRRRGPAASRGCAP